LASQAAKPITLSQGEGLGVCNKETIRHYFVPIISIQLKTKGLEII